MDLYETLLNAFGKDQPFSAAEIDYGNYSRAWLYIELTKLREEGKIIRHDHGIYYIPTKTKSGPSVLDTNKIITKKYINNGKDTIGFYSGATFLHKLHLIEECPEDIEIYTNNEPSNKRDVMVGKQKVILRRARTTVTAANVAVLSFLEMMNNIPKELLTDEKKPIIEKYISANHITRKDIMEYAPLFPDKAIRTLIQSGLIFSVAKK